RNARCSARRGGTPPPRSASLKRSEERDGRESTERRLYVLSPRPRARSHPSTRTGRGTAAVAVDANEQVRPYFDGSVFTPPQLHLLRPSGPRRSRMQHRYSRTKSVASPPR